MAVAIAWLPGPAGTRRRVAKPSVEEPDAAEPARPDLWGARVSNDPGLPDLLEASPFHGEGYRKAWAKLRVEGIRTSQERVRRLTREHDLQVPPRAGHAHELLSEDAILFLERVNDVTRLLVDPARAGHDEELQYMGKRRHTGRAEQRLSAVTNVATRRASSVESARLTASIGFLDSTHSKPHLEFYDRLLPISVHGSPGNRHREIPARVRSRLPVQAG